MELSTTTEVRVRFKEVDQLGIVWHGVYLQYFEDGREAFGREHGMSYLELKENQLICPIVKSSCEHKLPLYYGDVATVKTTFKDSLAAKIIFHYQVFNSEGKLCCSGETIQVFTDFNGVLYLDKPEFFKKWKEKKNL